MISCFDKPNRILALAQSRSLRTCKRRDGEMKQARSENMQKRRREVKPQRKTHQGQGFRYNGREPTVSIRNWKIRSLQTSYDETISQNDSRQNGREFSTFVDSRHRSCSGKGNKIWLAHDSFSSKIPCPLQTWATRKGVTEPWAALPNQGLKIKKICRCLRVTYVQCNDLGLGCS